MIRQLGVLLICALVLVSCDKSPPQRPVVVFATGEDGDSLSILFEKFTDDTDIPVTIVWGSSAENANKLIGNIGGPADVLITDNVADIWRAADRGALRPILSEAFDSLHAALKDPDRAWATFDVQFQVISNAHGAKPLIGRLEGLGNPEFSGRVCLSSSNLSINRSLITYLIEEKGVKEAERLVRRWVRNLAASPFATEAELAAALQSGQCDYGITSWPNDFEGVTAYGVEMRYIDANGAGVGRHAGNPEAAQKLLGWLLTNRRMEFGGDAEPVFAGIAGWRDEEARLLAERAGYR